MLKRMIKRLFSVKRDGAYYSYRLFGKEKKHYSNRLAYKQSNKAIADLSKELSSLKNNIVHIETSIDGVEAKLNRVSKTLKATGKSIDSSDRAMSEIKTTMNEERAALDSLEKQLSETASAIGHRQDKLESTLNRAHREELDEIRANEFRFNALFKTSVAHFSAFAGKGNAGDRLLVFAARDSIEKALNQGIYFSHKSVRAPFNSEIARIVNETNAMLIGGGGLFLCDTNRNDISGWQFPIPLNELDKIRVPIIMLGVGYNRFRGQEEFGECFGPNINALIERCKFVGLRNHGSMEALKPYLSESNYQKLAYHPCATTVLSKLYRLPQRDDEPPFIALNCAFDRAPLRFGKNQDEILAAIARVVKKLSNTYAIKYYAHMDTDDQMLPYLDAEGVDYTYVNLGTRLSIDQLLKAYSSPDLVFGMRGHAQLIPFGCCTPTVSIVTHDKLKWFLEDIEHPEWGVDVLSDDFEARLETTAMKMLQNREAIRLECNSIQDRLWSMMSENIREAFEGVF